MTYRPELEDQGVSPPRVHHPNDGRVLGTRIAGETALSRFVPYAFRGMSNPAAARLRARLAKAGLA